MGRSLYSVKRRDNRIFVALPVTMRVGWEGATVARGSTVDLSERGVRVRATIPFRLGQDVEVKVREENVGTKNYRVVWVRGDQKSGGYIYEAGLELQ